jgi:WD40 repeat protein
MTSTPVCPNAEELRQFLLGHTAEPEVTRLEEHLQTCRHCLAALTSLPAGDALIEAVRAQKDTGIVADPAVVGQTIERLKQLTLLAQVNPAMLQDSGPPTDNSHPPAGPTLSLTTLGGEPAPPAGMDQAAGVAALHDLMNPPQAPGELGQLGPYRLLKVLGTGGMGVVFEAEDPHLGRVVAVKTLLAHRTVDPSARQRFLREARLAAAVRHENIVTIFQVGEDRDVPYLAMELLNGEALEARFERVGQLSVVEVVRIGTELARGLAAAHQQGLIHRDVKPANVWLEAETGRVKLLDFGLARALSREPQLTEEGAIVGTPAFMSPEQVSGQDVDHRADLFSLGCILYTLATGVQPFRGKEMVATLMAVASHQPRPPHERSPEVPASLSGLVMSLLAKEPAQRPANASAVVESLAAIAQELKEPGRTRKSSVRRWAAAALALLFVGVLVTAAVVLRIQTDRGEVTVQTDDPHIELVAQRNGTLVQIRDTKSGQTWQLDTKKYTLSMADRPDGLTIALPDDQPFTLRRRGEGVVTIRRDSKSRPPIPVVRKTTTLPLDSLRRQDIPLAALGWPGGGDPKQAPAELVAILGDGRLRLLGDIGFPDFSPDGKYLAVPSGADVALFDAVTGQYLRTLAISSKSAIPPYRVRFSPDSATLACADPDQLVRLLDVATGREIATLSGHRGPVYGLAFSPDGQTLASAGADGLVLVWDVAKKAPRHTLRNHTGEVVSVEFSPDGTRLASGARDATARIWDLAEGKQHRVLRVEHFINPLHICVAFSPDGKQLACGSESAVTLWDARTFQEASTLREPAAFVTFTRDSRALLTSHVWHDKGEVHQMKRLSAVSGEVLATLPLGSQGAFLWCRLSPDGKTLATRATGERVLRLYDAETGKPRFSDLGHTNMALDVAFSPNGQLLASSSSDSTVRLWDLATGKAKRTLTGHTGLVRGAAFSPDGKLLASGDEANLRLWEVVSGRQLWAFGDQKGPFERVAFSPDGKLLAAASQDGTVGLWDVSGRGQLRVFKEFKSWVISVTFSSDGKNLAAVSLDRTVVVWDVATGARVRTLQHLAPGMAVAFVPKGEELITSWDDGLIHKQSLSDGKLTQTLHGPSPGLQGLAVRSDGRLIAASGAGGTLQLWDLSATPPQQRVFYLFPHGHWVRSPAFSPDGRHLATANPDGTVYVFRLGPPGKTTLPGLPSPDPIVTDSKPFVGHQGGIAWVAYSRNGKWGFSTGWDGTARMWDLATGKEVHRLRHPKRVLRLAVTPDDRYLVTSCEDDLVRVWDLDTGKEARRLEGTNHGCWNMSLSPDGRLAITEEVGNGRTMLVSDVTTGKEVRRFQLGGQCAFTPDGKSLLSGRVYSLESAGPQTGTVAWSAARHTAWIRDVAVSPDGCYALTCSGSSGGAHPAGRDDDCSVRLWDVKTGRELWRRQESVYTRWSVAFTPDSRRAIAGSYDGTVRVYDVATGKEVACLVGPAPVHGVAVSPDGRSVLAGGWDGVLRQYRLPDAAAGPPTTKRRP